MPLGVEKTTRPTKGKISPSKVYNMTNDELTRERFHVHTQCTKTHVHNVPIGLRLCITAGRCAYIRAVSKSTSLSCRSSVYIYAYIDRCRWLSPTVVRSFHIRLFLLFEILRYIFLCFFFCFSFFYLCLFVQVARLFSKDFVGDTHKEKHTAAADRSWKSSGENWSAGLTSQKLLSQQISPVGHFF